MGGLTLLRTGDIVRVDLELGTANMLVAEEEISLRRAAMLADGGYAYPDHQTPWQEIQRGMVDQFDKGMVLKPAIKYQRIAQTKGVDRDDH